MNELLNSTFTSENFSSCSTNDEKFFDEMVKEDQMVF